MRNSGSPPTHLPSPSHPPGFLFFKWEQPSKRAPEGDWWLNFPEWWHALCHEDWCVRARRKDRAGTMLRWPQEWPHPSVMQQDQAAHFMQWKRAAGGRPIHEYQRGATGREYMVWKRTLDNVVESAWARHHQAAHDCQEATAACACQEAAHRQKLLDEQAARTRQEAAAARARQEAACRAAARTIFLWLCRRRLHIRLACQTLRRQQREADLARLHYEDNCCARAALTNANRQQPAAVRVKDAIREQPVLNKAAINKAFDDICQSFDDIRQTFDEICKELRRAVALTVTQSMDAEALAAQASAKTLAEERRRQEVAARAAVLAAQASAEASADKRHHNEVAVHAAALAAQASVAALTEERRCQELAVQASAEASADERRRNEAAAHTAALAAQASADKRPPQTVCRRIRPCCRTGRRNRPRAPSPIDEIFPSTWGGPSPLISALPSLLARESATAGSPPCLEDSAMAHYPPCLETPSPLLFMMATSSTSLQPFDVTRVVSMLLEGGGAHPFRDRGLPLPPRKRARGRRHPCRVCRRHGPRAPNPLEPLLCGRRHRPRAPNKCGGWA
jgi:hypothetical protein